MLQDTNLAFIGSGTMAAAMIHGLLQNELLGPRQIVASGPREERGRELEERFGVNWTTDNRLAARGAQIVILSVKPQVLGRVLPELRGEVHPEALVLSIVAGAPIGRISKALGVPYVVRAMPNTPARIGQGITVWTSTEATPKKLTEQARAILEALGEEIWVDDERYLDMATALSGTGPAYVFLFMEALIDAGVHLGFSRRVAKQLVIQTMRGSVEYAAAYPDLHPATLRNQVTSPGGTSAEALYQMEKGGLRTVISRAVWAAYQRAVALGEGNNTHKFTNEEA